MKARLKPMGQTSSPGAPSSMSKGLHSPTLPALGTEIHFSLGPFTSCEQLSLVDLPRLWNVQHLGVSKAGTVSRSQFTKRPLSHGLLLSQDHPVGTALLPLLDLGGSP